MKRERVGREKGKEITGRRNEESGREGDERRGSQKNKPNKAGKGYLSTLFLILETEGEN